MNCTNCGAPVTSSWKHCAHCGAALPPEVARREAEAVGRGLSEGLRSGAPFTDAELATQEVLVSDARQAVTDLRLHLAAENRSFGPLTWLIVVVGGFVTLTFLGYAVPYAIIEGDDDDAIAAGIIGVVFALMTLGAAKVMQHITMAIRRRTPLPEASDEHEEVLAIRLEAAKLAEMKRQVDAYRRANPGT